MIMKQTMPNPNLPQEIIADILLRLSVNTLCQFKCVSKPWRALISDHHFTKLHFHRNSNSNQERVILWSRSLYSIDLESPQVGVDAVAVRLKFPSKTNPRHPEEILGSCNGLLLIADQDDSHFLVNPSTRESRKLSKSPFAVKSSYSSNVYGFGYDSSAEDHKVVRISGYGYEANCSDNIVSVYSLRTNSWKRIRDSPYCHTPNEDWPSSPGILVNGALHWLALRNPGSENLPVIGSLNLAEEEFRDVPPPSSVNHILLCELGVLGGCLCVIVPRKGICSDVWVMKEYGAKESWTKFTVCIPNMSLWKSLCLSRNGEVLLETDAKKLVLYDPKEETCKDLVVHGIPARFQAKTYVESLISPNWSNRIKRRHRAPRKGSRMDVRALKAKIKACEAKTQALLSKIERYRLIQASSSMNDPYSLSNSIDSLKAIKSLQESTYHKALKKFENPSWREAFILMPVRMKMAWLDRL